MDNKLSIFHITPFFSPNVGGVETHLENLTSYLKLKDYEQTVMTYQALAGSRKGEQKEISKGLKIFRLPWFSGLYYKTLFNPLVHFLYLTPWLLLNVFYFFIKNSKDTDIIHAHGINAAFIGGIVKFFFKKPLMTSLYVEFNFKRNNFLTNFYLWPLKYSDKILVMTEKSKNELKRCKVLESKITVYSHWINQEIFKPVEKRKTRQLLSLKEDQFIVLFVGRLTKEKGTYLLLDIAKNLENILFIVIASGDLLNTFKEEASKLKNILYTGRVDYDKLAVYYQTADLLIVPSLVSKEKATFEEGIPRVIMEALSCGTPIIGTDNGGIKEVIESGQVGFIETSNASSFSATIRKIAKNPSELQKMRIKCVDYARDRFNVKRASIIVSNYKQIYAGKN